MKDLIVFADSNSLAIEDGASLSNITHIAENEAAAVAACALVTPSNLSHVEFCKAEATDDPYGIYDNLALNAPASRSNNPDGSVTVTISLREKSDIELRLDALEVSQDIQDGAIEDLGAVISEMTEG